MGIRINDANNGAIGRRIFAFERKTCFLSTAPENQFADARAGRIYRHQRLSLGRKIFVEGLNDEQLPILKRIVFDRGNDGSDYAGQLHLITQQP